MATYTEHYGLHQWEATDNFLRTDFNADHQLIDAALAGKVEVVTGSYIGDDELSRIIDLGFTPKALLVVRQDGWSAGGSSVVGGIAFPGKPVDSYGVTAMELTGQGFQVYRGRWSSSYYGVDCNNSACTYLYMAVV